MTPSAEQLLTCQALSSGRGAFGESILIAAFNGPLTTVQAVVMPPLHSHRTVAQALSSIGGVTAAVLGAAVLVGWWFDIQVLKEVLPGLATMKFNTGLCFLAAGTAVALLDGGRAANKRLPIRVLASLVLVVGIATLAEYVTGTSFGIDEFFHLDDPNPAATSHPGRMAPSTALSFTFIGLALFASSRPSGKLPRRLATVSMVVAVLAVIGYAYGVTGLYQISAYSSMALHTAIGLLVLSLSLIAAHTRDGFMESWSATRPAGLPRGSCYRLRRWSWL